MTSDLGNGIPLYVELGMREMWAAAEEARWAWQGVTPVRSECVRLGQIRSLPEPLDLEQTSV
jgi:hypothetical protein